MQLPKIQEISCFESNRYLNDNFNDTFNTSSPWIKRSITSENKRGLRVTNKSHLQNSDVFNTKRRITNNANKDPLNY